MSSAVVDQSRSDAPDVAGDSVWSRIPALGRAGAVAAVIAHGPTSRLLRGSARIALLVSGSMVIAIGVAVMLWSGLGPGPLDVFIGAIRVRTGLPLAVALWLVIASLIAAAWLMGRRPGPGTLVSPLIVGPTMQVALSLLRVAEPPDSVAVLVVIHVAAVFVAGVGAGALIVSGLGAGSGELLASATSDRTGRSEPRLRMAFELTWLAFGVALGGPIGLGTIVVALTIGPAVMVGHRAVDGAVVRCRTTLEAVRRMEWSQGSTMSIGADLVAECCDGKQ